MSEGILSKQDIEDAMLTINEDFRRLNNDASQTRNTANAPFAPVAVDAKVEFRLAHLDPNGNCTNGIIRHYDANTNWSQTNVSAYAYSGNGTNRWATNKYLNIYEYLYLILISNRKLKYNTLHPHTNC